jgi:hypothetical protein
MADPRVIDAYLGAHHDQSLQEIVEAEGIDAPEILGEAPEGRS